MTTQSKNNNLDYLTNVKFGFHRLFVISLKNGAMILEETMMKSISQNQ